MKSLFVMLLLMGVLVASSSAQSLPLLTSIKQTLGSLVSLSGIQSSFLSFLSLIGVKQGSTSTNSQTSPSLLSMNSTQQLATLFSANTPHTSTPWTGPKDPDMNKTTAQIIQMRGWGVQLHHPVTPDGYILGVQRIVNPNGNPLTGKTIIMQHGILLSSICWVINDPNTGFYGEAINNTNVGGNLGFELAKRGYDVWLTNTRGNKYSRNHTTLTPNDPQFWDYSFDEMIKYDTPSVISYVQKVTGSPTVGWVGHSQGTLMMFGLLSRNNSYSSIVNPFVALAPVAYTSNLGGPLGYMVKIPGVGNMFESMPSRFPPNNFNVAAMAGAFCTPGDYICDEGLYFLTGGGMNTNNMNNSRAGVYIGTESLDSSDKNIAHYYFNSNEKKFQSFDYQLENPVKYGSLTPPQYVVSNIQSNNMALISSSGDYLGDPTDVATLVSQLNPLKVNLTGNWYINDTQFSHMNFIWGYQVGQLVNSRVIQILGK